MATNESMMLTGTETRLYTYNQLYKALNDRTGHKYALSTFARFLSESGVRPCFVTASKEPSGLYSDADLDRIVGEIESGSLSLRRREKKVVVKMTPEEHEAWLAGRE